MVEYAVLALVLSQPVPKKGADLALDAVVKSIKDSSVRVQFRVKTSTWRDHEGNPHDNFQEATSSGTVVQAGKDHFYVLTCAHGLYHQDQRLSKFTVQGPVNGGPTYRAKVLADCRKRDVAVLLVEDAKGHKFKTSLIGFDETYAKPVPVIRCGHPFNKNRVIVHGTTRDKTYINGLPDAKAVSARPHAIQGDSGGGLFRTKDGRLVGVTVSSNEETMVAVSVPTIEYILKKAGVVVER